MSLSFLEQEVLVNEIVLDQDVTYNVLMNYVGPLQDFIDDYYREKFDFGFMLNPETYEKIAEDCYPRGSAGLGIDTLGPVPLVFIIPKTNISLRFQEGNILKLRKLYICSKEQQQQSFRHDIYWVTL